MDVSRIRVTKPSPSTFHAAAFGPYVRRGGGRPGGGRTVIATANGSTEAEARARLEAACRR